jgi:hypothetical protein
MTNTNYQPFVETRTADKKRFSDGSEAESHETGITQPAPGEGRTTLQRRTTISTQIDKPGQDKPTVMVLSGENDTGTYYTGSYHTNHQLMRILPKTGEFSVYTVPSYDKDIETRKYSVNRKSGGGYELVCIDDAATNKFRTYPISAGMAQDILGSSIAATMGTAKLPEGQSFQQELTEPQVKRLNALLQATAVKPLQGVSMHHDDLQATVPQLLTRPAVQACVGGAYKK